ncbi:MAG: hypothetical protein AAFR59_14845, partial [Bacteroidota bacterium]
MNTQDLAQIRFLYREGVNHEEPARQLWEMMERYEGNEGIMWAYKASARALMANYDWNPVQQLWYINECMKWFRKGKKRISILCGSRFTPFLNHFMHSL